MSIKSRIKYRMIKNAQYNYVKNSDLFDAEWYSRRYKIPIKDVYAHYITEGWKLGYDPSLRFSTKGYLNYYPDVMDSGTAPLVHYEMYGKRENRKICFDNDCSEIERTYNYIFESIPPVGMKSCAVFASYCPDGIIPEYVVYYIDHLLDITDGVIFIADNELTDPGEIAKIRDKCFYINISRHEQFDFGSWKTGTEWLRQQGILDRIDTLVLANDSCYGPVNGFKSVYESMEEKKYDFWGLLDVEKPVYHICSFFYVFHSPVFNDELFIDFFASIDHKMKFWDVVNNCELKLAGLLRGKYSCGSMISVDNERMAVVSGNFNPATWPIYMIEHGFPLIKVKNMDGRFGLDCRENPDFVLKYLAENNKELYDIILRDLQRRMHVKCRTRKQQFDDYCLAITESKSVVTFDVFDTLLCRPFCSPSDVFLYMEHIYEMPGFAAERINAEKKARIDSPDEVTLDEIYQHILPKFRHMKEKELSTEEKILYQNVRVKPLYDQAVERGKKVAAVSDMYLPESFIRGILVKNGYTDIDHVFVSSEYKKTKGSLLLYGEVADYYKCSADEIIHFGDNPVADCQCARQAGIEAYTTSKCTDLFLDMPSNAKYTCFFRQRNNLASSVYISLMSKYYYSVSDASCFYNMIGYAFGGPLALSYLYYVCEEAKRNNADHLMFVARDGYGLKELYSEFFSSVYNFESSYAYLNRAVVLSAVSEEENVDSYIKTLLMMYNTGNDRSRVYVYDSPVLNREEYLKHKTEIDAWQKTNKERLSAHLNDISHGAQKIAVVDMVTGQYTSLKGAAACLGSRLCLGIFSANYHNSDTSLPFSVFCDRYIDKNDELAVKLSELLITSPECSVTGLKDDLSPQYDACADTKKASRYYEIFNGIREYLREYFSMLNPNTDCLMTFDDWVELANMFCRFCNEVDLAYLSDAVDTPEPIDNMYTRNLVECIRDFKKMNVLQKI